MPRHGSASILLCHLLATASGFALLGACRQHGQAAALAPACRSVLLRLEAAAEDEAAAAPGPPSQPEEAAAAASPPTPAVPSSAAPAPPPPEEGPRKEPLKPEDLVNTQWRVVATPRPEGWLGGDVREQEFTLLDDYTVVWGGSAGGFGTGGRWTLKDGMLEVIRTTPLGLVTGRDYYMAAAEAGVSDSLQFELDGIIRSYNALYPVAVVADFVATRQPGRFTRNTE